MQIKINLEKKYIYFLTALVIAIMGLGYVIAYGGASPATVGHSAGELDLTPLYIINSMVGIGAMSPADKLTIGDGSSNTDAIRLVGTGGKYLQLLSGTQINAVGNPLIFQIGGSEKVRITDTGSVGIGTTSPGYPLEIKAGTVSAFLQPVASTEFRFGSASTHPLTIYTGGTERMRIDTSGNVGIGTTSPEKNLHIAGGANTGIRLEDTGWINWDIVATRSATAGRLDILRSDGTTNVLSIVEASGGGNVGIGTTKPSSKLQVVGGPINATGGLIIETRTSDPANPETGRMWLITS